jgi:hypothetical protein
LRGLRWEDYDGTQIIGHALSLGGFSNEPKTKRSKAILAAHKLACVNPKGGPMFANGKGKPTNVNNVLNRQILPVLNR